MPVNPQPAITDLSEFIEVHDPEGRVEEIEALIASRRRKAIDPPILVEPESPIVEEASPSTIVAEVLGDVGSEEVVETHPETGGETGGTQSFAFT